MASRVRAVGLPAAEFPALVRCQDRLREEAVSSSEAASVCRVSARWEGNSPPLLLQGCLALRPPRPGGPPGVACWCPIASAGGKLVHRTPSTTDLQKSLGGKKSNRRLLLSKTIKCFLMRVAVIYWLFVISPEAPTSMT